MIQTSDLSRAYGEKVAVNHLNLSVKKGEVFGLLGPNGAGKTTTILMLLGLTEPTAGKASIDGIDCTRNSMKVKKLKMLPLECIVRGYITGSGWESYKENGTVCGIKLRSGLKECEKLDEPIYTPSTKAELGLHDENISYERSIEELEKVFPGKGGEYAKKLKEYTIALYKKCADYAYERGIIIADTKFEFGLDENGEIILGDEMLTPDSSRFWPLAGYEAGKSQPSYDKQYVRDWLKANPDSDYNLPDDVIAKTVEKYKEAFKMLTGKDFAR